MNQREMKRLFDILLATLCFALRCDINPKILRL